jgi:hypothetical protein
MRPVEFERGHSILFLAQISKSSIKYWTRGILYKFVLPERPKINKVWESYPNFHLAHLILVRPVTLQRRHFRVLQVEISDSKGPKFHKYIRRKVGHKDRLQTKGLKGM